MGFAKTSTKRKPAQVASQELRLDDHADDPYTERDVAPRVFEGQRGAPVSAFERMLQARYQVALFQQARYGKINLAKVERPVMESLPIGQISSNGSRPSSRLQRPASRLDIARTMRLRTRGGTPRSPATPKRKAISPERPPPTPDDGGHEEACRRFMARMILMRAARGWIARMRVKRAKAERQSAASQVLLGNPAWALEKPPLEEALSKDLPWVGGKAQLPPKAALLRPPLPPRIPSPRALLPNSASLPSLPNRPLSPALANLGKGGVALSTVAMNDNPFRQGGQLPEGRPGQLKRLPAQQAWNSPSPTPAAAGLQHPSSLAPPKPRWKPGGDDIPQSIAEFRQHAAAQKLEASGDLADVSDTRSASPAGVLESHSAASFQVPALPPPLRVSVSDSVRPDLIATGLGRGTAVLPSRSAVHPSRPPKSHAE